MAEFCKACNSLIVNNKCSNRGCPLKIEESKKLQKKMKKMMDDIIDEIKQDKSKNNTHDN